MSGISPIYAMLIAWGAVTAVLVVLLIYRSLISMKEDDQLFLSAGEARLEQEQREVISRLQRTGPLHEGIRHRVGRVVGHHGRVRGRHAVPLLEWPDLSASGWQGR